jgi:hypothetical protein
MPALLRRPVSAGAQPCQGRSSLDMARAPAEYGSSREAQTGKITQIEVSTLPGEPRSSKGSVCEVVSAEPAADGVWRTLATAERLNVCAALFQSGGAVPNDWIYSAMRLVMIAGTTALNRGVAAVVARMHSCTRSWRTLCKAAVSPSSRSLPKSAAPESH